MRNDNWHKINSDLSEKLKGHIYTFIEVWSIVGCGEKTLRRYMDRLLVTPIKTSDNWLFDEDMLAKVDFIHKCKTKLDIPVNSAAGLYDFLKANKVKQGFEDLENSIKEYNV